MTQKQKNKKMVFIGLLVLCVLATGAFIGTLAKYVTSGNVGDSADVAKFGLNIPTEISLFSDSYTNVKADVEGDKIIAPGTEGRYKFEVTGTSEVAYKVSADIAITYSEAWDGYTPLLFSLNGTDWTGDLAAFQTSLNSALDSEIMAPGAAYASEQTIHWQWPFHVSAELDIKDTQMGAIAATETAPEVTVSIQVTAAQID